MSEAAPAAQPQQKPTYLGDGVYAHCDGYHIWLQAERHGMTHMIALEPSVLANLNVYAERLRQTPPTP